jgi:hypothetical protein
MADVKAIAEQLVNLFLSKRESLNRIKIKVKRYHFSLNNIKANGY